jgi:hypothetical protein
MNGASVDAAGRGRPMPASRFLHGHEAAAAVATKGRGGAFTPGRARLIRRSVQVVARADCGSLGRDRDLIRKDAQGGGAASCV